MLRTFGTQSGRNITSSSELLTGRFSTSATGGSDSGRKFAVVQCSSASFGGSRRGGKGGGKGERKARQPGLFEVKVITPPPQSLGIYALPPYTHNGEEIEIEGQGYVVTSLIMHYKLVKGKYVREHSRLEVQPTGRYFLNMMLENLVRGKYIGPTGQQD